MWPGFFNFNNLDMDAFQYALEKTLQWEGGYQSNPNDPGNYNSKRDLIGTNLGISAPVLEKHLGRLPLHADMKYLTVDMAAKIYETYWTAVRAGEIRQPEVAALVFDMAVNHGPSSAIRAAQRAVGAKADGKMGPITLAKLNRGEWKEIVNRMVAERIVLYGRIVARSPKMNVFYRGWIRRAKAFEVK